MIRLLVCLALLASPSAAQVNWDAWKPKDQKPTEYPDLLIEADALAATLDDVVVLDVRTPAEYLQGHVPEARSYEFGGEPLDEDSIQEALGRLGLSGDESVVVVGGARDGLEVGRLFWMLERAGQRQARVLNGGMAAWRAAGHTEDLGVAPARTRSYTAEADPDREADFDYVLEHLGWADRVLLDWRTPEEWAEGHVPHSLPFPLEKLLKEDGRLRTGDDLRNHFATWGPRPREYVSLSGEIIVLGSGPPRSLPVHPYLAARLAGLSVRFYPLGTTDWKRHPHAPLVRMISAEGVRERLLVEWGGDELIDLPPADLMLFDLRGERDFQVGHIPGAVWLQPHTFAEDLPRAVREYWPGADPREVPVILYCYGPTCTRSRNCATMAAQQGFTRLFWFKDGTQGWKGLGEPLVREPNRVLK